MAVATPRPLYPRYPLYRRLGGPQGRCGRVRKFSVPHRDSIPGPSSPWRVAIQTALKILLLRILARLGMKDVFKLFFVDISIDFWPPPTRPHNFAASLTFFTLSYLDAPTLSSGVGYL